MSDDETGNGWKIQLIAVLIGGALAILGSFMAYQIQLHDLKQQAANNYIGDLKFIDMQLSNLITYEKSHPMDYGTGKITCINGVSSDYNQSTTLVNFPDILPGEIYPSDWGFYYRSGSEIGRFKNATLVGDLFAFYRAMFTMNEVEQEFSADNVYIALKTSDLTIPVQRRGKRYTLLVCAAKAHQPEISRLEEELHQEANQW